MRNAETNIQNRIMLELSAAGWMVWRNNTGKFRAISDPSRIVTVGQVGSPDILAVCPTVITADMVGQTIGVCVGIEVKTATGKQSPEQKRWQEVFQHHGGVYQLRRE
jgi:hypothetical protein